MREIGEAVGLGNPFVSKGMRLKILLGGGAVGWVFGLDPVFIWGLIGIFLITFKKFFYIDYSFDFY
ncbi:MAG: hypothetical protein U5K54_11865 [Cytophagales bacterium]|nr:hypothetical protein [Cytophagales bacterium]